MRGPSILPELSQRLRLGQPEPWVAAQRFIAVIHGRGGRVLSARVEAQPHDAMVRSWPDSANRRRARARLSTAGQQGLSPRR